MRDIKNPLNHRMARPTRLDSVEMAPPSKTIKKVKLKQSSFAGSSGLLQNRSLISQDEQVLSSERLLVGDECSPSKF